jgi:GDP-mannose 6-dehydrogenase
VQIAKLVGANRDFVLNRIPHIAALMVDNMAAVMEHGQTIVIGNKDPEFRTIPDRLNNGQCVVDLVRIANFGSRNGTYECIC